MIGSVSHGLGVGLLLVSAEIFAWVGDVSISIAGAIRVTRIRSYSHC